MNLPALKLTCPRQKLETLLPFGIILLERSILVHDVLMVWQSAFIAREVSKMDPKMLDPMMDPWMVMMDPWMVMMDPWMVCLPTFDGKCMVNYTPVN